jgi:hypothetical protein
VVASVSGPQSGYTITLQSNTPVAITIPVGTPVTYNGNYAGGETVEYLNIQNNPTASNGTITSGANWTIEHNEIANGHLSSSPSAGMALYEASNEGGNYSFPIFHGGTIEYNCLENEGHSGIHEFGYGSVFKYNEVLNTPYYNDNSGDAGDKWWGTLNSEISDNSFIQNGPGGPPIWLDNGNTGYHIEGNYIAYSWGTSISLETAFNGDVSNNTIVNSGWGAADIYGPNGTSAAISVNQTGSWNIPGSNYNNPATGCPAGQNNGCLLILNNTMTDDWQNVAIWGAGSRSCMNPQEQSGTSAWNNWPACTGGFPNGDDAFSIYNFPSNFNSFGRLTAAARSGATSLYVNTHLQTAAVGDYIGFTGVSSTGYPNTTTTSTAAVTSFTGSQTLPVASTTGFSSAGGMIQAATSTVNSAGRNVGAIFTYTGFSGTKLTGVNFLQGSGNLVNGGFILAFEPYKITAVSGTVPYVVLTISPPLAANEAARATLYNDGTCYDQMTGASTPASPLAPNGSSYFDGCIWEQRNITVSHNTENFRATDISGGQSPWSGPPWNNTSYQNCVAGTASIACGTNFSQFQVGGNPPYGGLGSWEMMNAFASNPNFMTPITAGWNGTPTGSPVNGGETPWNITWSNNTYNGSIYFFAYNFGACYAPSPYSCFVDIADWTGTGTGQWHQG